MITLTIFTAPVAKGRPRFFVAGGRVGSYTPAKTRNSEQMIQALIRTEFLNVKLQPMPAGIPLRMEATFFRERPKSLPKKAKMPVQKPDYDNYAKLLCDALQGYLFPNDSQICTATIKKRFAQPGTMPRIELRLSEDSFDQCEYEYTPQSERMLI